MISGFGGHLISEQFLEQTLAASDAGAATAAFFDRIRQWRVEQLTLGPASSWRALLECSATPLARALDFTVLDDERTLDAECVSLAARSGNAIVTIVVTRYGEPLGPLWRLAIRDAGVRAADWALLFNGTHLRLVDTRRAASRRFVEFDLDAAADNDGTAHALWTLANARSLYSQGPGSTADLIRLSDRHGADVCRSLRRGVQEASIDILRALMPRARRQTVTAAFPQALTLVYRLLFLFFAEARGLVPLWHPIYRDHYSLQQLCAAAADPEARGLWDTVQALGRLAHAGCRAGDLRVTAYNGRLFAPSRAPLVELPRLPERSARRALIALSTREAEDGEGRVPIAYRDLGVEQLGAVYETLLDYAPVEAPAQARDGDGAARPVTLRAGSSARKSTGSFYTPEPLVRYLLRRTLGPMVRDATPEQILSLRVLDPSMGSGAFLVGACRYLANAYAEASIANGGCHATDLGPAERASIRRTIAERCLYGVDLNPMAVQLAQLSLWLATLSAERPLGFLDHHLVSGNSLLGVWLSTLRHAPAKRRPPRELPLFADNLFLPMLRDTLPVRFSLAHAPTATVEQVRAKESALARLAARDSTLERWKRVANLWTAFWLNTDLALTPALYQALTDTILSGKSSLAGHVARPLLDQAEATAAAQHPFHWELEFPEVFFTPHGERRADAGFDAVIGNPPWDMLRDDAASNDLTPAAGTAARVVRFARDAGVYHATGDGHANCYQLFLERSLRLLRAGGRLGMVLPSGLLADQGSAALRRLLFATCRVDTIAGFENRRAIFAIHRSTRFVLLNAQAGEPTRATRLRLGEIDIDTLENACDDHGAEHAGWWPVTVTPAALAQVSGSGLAVPELRTSTDLAIVEGVAQRFETLGAAWHVSFGRELNATEDHDLFTDGQRRAVCVVEGRQVHPFAVRVQETRFSMSAADAHARLGDQFRRPRLAYRDVASVSNRQTLIAALLPANVASLHTVHCLKTPIPLRMQWYLCGLFNSFVVNYLVRLRVSTHVTAAIVEQLPVPTADAAGPAFRPIATLARRLARSDDADARAYLQARVARLYELTVEEFAHIVATFPLVGEDERARAVREFRRW